MPWKKKKQKALIETLADLDAQYNDKVGEYDALLENLFDYLDEKGCYNDNNLKLILNEIKYECKNMHHLEERIERLLDDFMSL